MEKPHSHQKFQDWITQQWVIRFGEKINSKQNKWLLGPFGQTDGIGEKFIQQLAENESLVIDKSNRHKGLLHSINQLNLTEEELKNLSKEVIDFYENTGNYILDLDVKWNPYFRLFGGLLKVLFSTRIQQLNIPMNNRENSKALKSEIIHLIDKKSKTIKRIVWLRTFIESKQVVYSGVYETCIIPSGLTCIKAIFPLPNGSATVILHPSVGKKGELILTSSGKKMGDSGFYFLLEDVQKNVWAKFIKSFKDELIVSSKNKKITATQILTLWNLKVLTFTYKIQKRNK